MRSTVLFSAVLLLAAGGLPEPAGVSAADDVRCHVSRAPVADAVPESIAEPGNPTLVVDRFASEVHLEAVVQRDAFERGGPPDGGYHGIVNEDGSAAGKALFLTAASDTEVAAALRALGAEDGGGVPLRAWTLRNVPLLPQPDALVSGSPIVVTVTWDGADHSYPLDQLLQDTGGRGMEMRFGGNEEHDAHWDSGCILCLFSCPGGVVSNRRYSIRDHVRGTTRFLPGPDLPSDGTPVKITLQVSP